MPLFFDTFTRRTRLRGELRCVTALRIGAGRSTGESESDLPVLRDARGKPIIPGASLKGVVRSAVEALLRARNEKWAPDPFQLEEIAVDEHGSAAERAKDVRAWLKEHCDVASRIFGRTDLASHVVFADAPALGEVTIELRDGVAIDRDLGRVSGARKYDFEVVPAGTRFALDVTMRDLDDEYEGAVLEGLELLHEGFARIGGFKSRGLGLVELDAMKVTVLEGPDLRRETVEWSALQEKRVAAFRQWMAKGGA